VIRIKRTVKAVLLLFFLVAPLFAVRTSEYFKNRLRYSPHFIYYQRQYLLQLIVEKKISRAISWIKAYKKKEIHPGRALLLRGMLLAGINKISEAKKIWRLYWPHARSGHFYLEREYKRYNLRRELRFFYSYLSLKFPLQKIFFKRACLYSLYGGSPTVFFKSVRQLLEKKFYTPSSIARSLYGYLQKLDNRKPYLMALNRSGTKELYLRILIYSDRISEAAAVFFAAFQKKIISVKAALSIAVLFRKHKMKNLYIKFLRCLSPKQLPFVHRLALAQSMEQAAPHRAESLYRTMENSPEAFRGISRILWRRGKLKAALFVQKKIKLPNKEDYKIRGILYSLTGHLQRAIYSFRNLFVADKALYTALSLIVAGKKPKEVVRSLSMGLRQFRGDGKAVAPLRLLYHLTYFQLNSVEWNIAGRAVREYWKGNLKKTATLLLTIASKRKQAIASWFFLTAAQVFERLGRILRALIYYKKSSMLGSSVRDWALFRIAFIYKYRLKRKQEAKRLFLHIIAKYPDSLYLYEPRTELRK